MRLPLSWLNEYVQVDDLDPKELAEKLTRAGLQVETIETVGEEALSPHIVAAEILTCQPHPDSDHLHVCTVSDGTDEFQVVCGAPNCRRGLKTALARIGAVIPGLKDSAGRPIVIKKGKLRGIESFGMCYSEKELLVGAGEAGIIEFPPATANGTLVRDLYRLPKPEVVFDIEVTWNRPDALSILGLAREFGAILHRPVKLPAVDFTEDDVDVNSEVKVIVEDPEACPRYTARVILDVEDGPSPELMAKRLELCGVRSLGLVVDVTNYVMLELGAPMHAFDHTRLKGRTIVVRKARALEKMRTLDGVERTLDPSMLVIADTETPNAIAGVMGGAESEIAPGTRTVMLESALFEPQGIKDTATRLDLQSESSYRYIRGVNKAVANFASRRAAHLLQKYGRARIAKGFVDIDHREVLGPAVPFNAIPGVVYTYNAPVTLNFERARRLIGINIGNDVMVYILESIGLRTVKKHDHFAAEEEVEFAIPSWRWDLTLEADLVEEIARLYGLDNNPDTMPSAPSISALDNRPFAARVRLREVLTALGFSEAMHYSFLSAKELDDFDPRPERVAARLVIPDPVSAEYAVMRPSLLPQLYAALGRNAAHEADGAMLFETGKVFGQVVPKHGGANVPIEREMLALGFVGPVGRGALARRAPLEDGEALLWMKGAVEELVRRLHAGALEFADTVHPAFANGAALEVRLNGKAVGVMGAVSARLRHPFRLTTRMVLCELELKPLVKRTDCLGRVEAVSPFPSVRRDIALTAAATVRHADIEAVIRRHGGKELAAVTLFDIYKDSRAYSLEFRSPERTLTDEEVGRIFQRIVDALKATAGIEGRES